jgi:Fe-S-cluster containining protein
VEVKKRSKNVVVRINKGNPMSKKMIDPKKHANYGFNGCSACDAKCCSSNIVFASLYDIDKATEYFPVLFYVRDGLISPVYFFYYGEKEGQKCPYLSNSLCTIYETRPYACRSYPFSFEKSHAYYDDGCPQIAPLEPSGMSLFEKNKINTDIMKNFVSNAFHDQKEKNNNDSGAFVKFCLDSNFLVSYKDFYASSPLHQNFKPSLLDQLYILHPQRIGVMRMKNKEIFKDTPEYLDYIVSIIKSQSNIEKLHSLL